MKSASLFRALGLSLALLLPATMAHANFEGTRESYPHDPSRLITLFKPGYYLIDYKTTTSIARRTVILSRNADGTYKVESSIGNATIGVYPNGSGTCVTFINEDGSKVYGYFITTCKTSGANFAFDYTEAARIMLKRRNTVKKLPSGTAQGNLQFLQQLARKQPNGSFMVVRPIKTPK